MSSLAIGLALGLWLQLPYNAGIVRLPPVPRRARIVMDRKPKTASNAQDEGCAYARPPSPLHIRRMINGFHLAHEGELESFLQYGCAFDGTVRVDGKIFHVSYEAMENLWTDWPSGKWSALFGPDPDCCDDRDPPMTRARRARLRWYGFLP